MSNKIHLRSDLERIYHYLETREWTNLPSDFTFRNKKKKY